MVVVAILFGLVLPTGETGTAFGSAAADGDEDDAALGSDN